MDRSAPSVNQSPEPFPEGFAPALVICIMSLLRPLGRLDTQAEFAKLQQRFDAAVEAAKAHQIPRAFVAAVEECEIAPRRVVTKVAGVRGRERAAHQLGEARQVKSLNLVPRR